MHWRSMIAIVIAACAVGSAATAAARRGTAAGVIAPARGVASFISPVGPAGRPSRPDRTDWRKIRTASGLRRLALAPHRTSHFRSVAASLGLGELVSIRPLAPGRCRTAVIDLYDNLLDLENASPGEDWAPLRRAVAREPSINACAPGPADPDGSR
jgi:hypothetical protein